MAGVLLSFALTFGGSWLTWLLLVGNFSQNKEGLDRWMVLQSFVLIPGMAVVVGAFVSWLVPRASWWLGWISLLPLVVYGFIRGESRAEGLLSLACLSLGALAAFLVSRFKHAQRPA